MAKKIFISGTHGSGKSTTAKTLCQQDDRFVLFQCQDGDHSNPYQECFRRQIWRLGKYFLDALDVLEKSSALGQNQILVVDRCVFDTLAYIETFYQLGWLTTEQHSILLNLYRTYYSNKELIPRNIILFFPSFAWTKRRILDRWNEEKKKWQEGNFDYLALLRKNYQSSYNLFAREKVSNILFVKETDMDSRIKKIIQWTSKI